MKRNIIWLSALVFPVVTSVIFALLGFPLGFNNSVHNEENDAEVEPAVLSYSMTPAARAFDEVFENLDKTWEQSGIRTEQATLPHPFDCVKLTPALSTSQTYLDKGREIQVTLSAYQAGVGAVAMNDLRSKTPTCKPSHTTFFVEDGEDQIGAESFEATASWRNSATRATVFRLGDVVAYVTVNRRTDARGNAEKVQKALSNALRAICVNHYSGVKDGYRNAFFAKSDFTGLTEKHGLETEPVDFPEVTEEAKMQGVQPILKKPKKITVKDAGVPTSDFGYPVWPLMPKAVSLPEQPSWPSKQKLTDFAELRKADTAGPGCGWNFLATVKPEYNQKRVDAQNDTLIQQAQDRLDAGGARWQAHMLQYWADYVQFYKDIDSYDVYRVKVKAVLDQWEIIHEQWRNYYTHYEAWEKAEQARQDLIDRKEQARIRYEEQIKACEYLPDRVANWQNEHKRWREVLVPRWEQAVEQFRIDRPVLIAEWEVKHAEWEVKHQQWRIDYAAWESAGKVGRAPTEPKEPARPTAPKKPVEPVRPTLSHPCPPVRPSLLDVEVPERKEPPKKPADPRPVDKRD